MKYILPFLLFASVAFGQLPAFPGAEGYAKNATGGRNTSTAKLIGVGTAAEFIAAWRDSTGPRYIIPDSATTIVLTADVQPGDNDVTYLGMLAPGDGFVIRGAGLRISGGAGGPDSNIVMRYAHWYIGDSIAGESYDNRDAFQIQEGSYNIYFDHCSFHWWTDANQLWEQSGKRPENITISYCYFVEPLHNNLHPKEPHARILTATGNGGTSVGSLNVSILHNLFIHFQSRGTNIKRGTENAEIIGNVYHNWIQKAINIEPSAQATNTHVIGNWFQEGADGTGVYEIQGSVDPTAAGSKMYLSHNVGPHRANNGLPEWDATDLSSTYQSTELLFEPNAVTEYWTGDNSARDRVAYYGGARIPALLPADSQAVQDLLNDAGLVKDGVALTTIYYPDTTVVAFGDHASFDTVYVHEMPISDTTPGRYNGQILEVDFGNNGSWDEQKTIISTLVPGNDVAPDTMALVTANWSTNPSPGDGVRFHKTFSDPTRVTIGYPSITPASYPTDTDGDFIPDAYENFDIDGDGNPDTGNPAVWDSRGDTDGDGWPDIEEYANYIVAKNLRQKGVMKR